MIKKCILLAAGLGARLQPLTNSTPKCLVKIKGRPLLEYWLVLLQKHGIKDVLINTHHLHHQVSDYIDSIVTSLEITLSYEEDLLGSYTTLVKNKNYYKEQDSILVANADNLTNINLSNFFEYHYSNPFGATVALIKTENPTECGIVEMNFDNKIISYEEKPSFPRSDLSNAGIYIFDKILLDKFEENTLLLDIGYDLLPRLVDCSSGYVLTEFLIDIGSHFSLDIANKLPYDPIVKI
jgi:mannose-1-phosphate guanylyltransferase